MSEIQKIDVHTGGLSYSQELTAFESSFIVALKSYGLPSEGVLVSVLERGRVFINAPSVINLLDEQKKAILYTYLDS